MSEENRSDDSFDEEAFEEEEKGTVAWDSKSQAGAYLKQLCTSGQIKKDEDVKSVLKRYPECKKYKRPSFRQSLRKFQKEAGKGPRMPARAAATKKKTSSPIGKLGEKMKSISMGSPKKSGNAGQELLKELTAGSNHTIELPHDEIYLRGEIGSDQEGRTVANGKIHLLSGMQDRDVDWDIINGEVLHFKFRAGLVISDGGIIYRSLIDEDGVRLYGDNHVKIAAFENQVEAVRVNHFDSGDIWYDMFIPLEIKVENDFVGCPGVYD